MAKEPDFLDKAFQLEKAYFDFKSVAPGYGGDNDDDGGSNDSGDDD